MKWVALTLLVIGAIVTARADPMKKAPMPLHVIAGWLSLVIGVAWLAALVFLAL